MVNGSSLGQETENTTLSVALIADREGTVIMMAGVNKRLPFLLWLLWCGLGSAESDLSYYNALYHGQDAGDGARLSLFKFASEYPTLVEKRRPIEFDAVLGVPMVLWADRTTMPSIKSSTVYSGNDIERITRGYLNEYAAFYRLNEDGLATARLKQVHRAASGCIIATFHQVISGVEVFGLELDMVMDRAMELVCVTGCLSPTVIPLSPIDPQFTIGFQESAAVAFKDLTGEVLKPDWLEHTLKRAAYHYYDLAGPRPPINHRLSIPIRTKKVLFQLPQHLEPGYYMEIKVHSVRDSLSRYFAYVISAVDGKLLLRSELRADSEFSYTVLADSSGEFTPFDSIVGNDVSPHPTGKNDQFSPPFVRPQSVTLSNIGFSQNDPWLPAGATETKGNNVDAFVDLFSPEGVSTGDFRAATTGLDEFDYTYDPLINPDANTNQQMAAIVNAFYVTNFLHDWFYDVGFDESSGNAQKNNFGRGGAGNDVLVIQGQSFMTRNSASMCTPADGESPIMDLAIFDDPLVLSPEGYTTVIAPSDIAGDYPARISRFFGPKTFDVTGEVVLVDDGVDIATDACEDIVNGAELVGKIALIDRRVCLFTEKVLKAQNEGAIAVIIANNAGPSLPPLGGSNGDVVIPTMGIGEEHGKLLKNAMENGDQVITRLHDETIIEEFVNRAPMLDNTVIAHEWGHYMSTRLVGGNIRLGNNQGRSLGEGWADFTTLLMVVRPEDSSLPANQNFGGVYPGPGVYTTGDSYFGFRRYPYSTDVNKNPLFFRHIEDGTELPDPNNGGPPVAFGQAGFRNSEVHNSGEVWCTMLWECYASLLNDPRYTFKAAQNRMKEYLVASLKITPPTPTFTAARDALLGVAAATDHDDFVLLSAAFAKRGMGVGAVSPDRLSTDHAGVVESFAVSAQNARLEIVSVTLVETENSCDTDGFLDVGETAVVTVTLKNSGQSSLSNTIGSIMSTENINFSDGGIIFFPSSIPGQEISASVEASLMSAPQDEIRNLEFTVSYGDSHPEVTIKFETVPFPVNLDEVPNEVKIDNVENGNDGWSLIKDIGTVDVWRIEPLDSDSHIWLGVNVEEETDQSIVSPELQVDASGSFSLSFDHRYAFEPKAVDGGVVELSDDGGTTWVDIGQLTTIGYNGILSPTNPLGGRAAYVNASPNYPEFIQETITLGSEYNGETVKVRFRVATDSKNSAAGWSIDNIQFQGIVNTPFTATIDETEFCGFCGNAFYGGNTITGAESLGGSQAGDPNVMAGVLFDPADFGFSGPVFITEICVSDHVNSEGPWENKLCLYPDHNGMPNDNIILGEGIISTGDGTGTDRIAFDPPIVHEGRFWVMNRGDASIAEGLFNLEFDNGPGTHSYSSVEGINGLLLRDELNYHIRATLLDTNIVSFSSEITTTVSEDNDTAVVGVKISVINNGPPEGNVIVDVIDTGGGTAEAPEDYIFSPQTVVFPSSSADGTIVTIDFSITDDDVLEGDETIELQLANIRGPATIVEDLDVHQVIISDFMVSLQKGWNLISLPLEPSQTLETMFRNVLAGNAYAWNVDEVGSTFIPKRKRDVLKAFIGYWIYSRASTAVHFPAKSLQNASVETELSAGWNLWGPATTVTSPYSANIMGSIWFWENNKFHNVSRDGGRLSVGKAYWINSTIRQPYPPDLKE